MPSLDEEFFELSWLGKISHIVVATSEVLFGGGYLRQAQGMIEQILRS